MAKNKWEMIEVEHITIACLIRGLPPVQPARLEASRLEMGTSRQLHRYRHWCLGHLCYLSHSTR